MNENEKYFPDFNVFTIESILLSLKNDGPELTQFIMECFYIRCEINPYDKSHFIKNELISNLLANYPIDKRRQTDLRKVKDWDFTDQINFGNQIFMLLLRSYKEISKATPNAVSESDKKDLTILGRRISAYYVKKEYKVSVIQKPTRGLNISNLTLSLKNSSWQVCNDNDLSAALITVSSIVFVMAYLVWNDLFTPGGIRMRPNSSNITLQEVINLGKKIHSFFGTNNSQEIDFSNYLKGEKIEKLMVVLDFETSPWYVNTKDYCVIYTNCWGEMFVRQFSSTHKFESYMRKMSKKQYNIQISYYVQRNTSSFEKLIERAKQSSRVTPYK